MPSPIKIQTQSPSPLAPADLIPTSLDDGAPRQLVDENGITTDALSADARPLPDRGRDAISEGKQKAKVILAASTALVDGEPARAPTDHDRPATPTPDRPPMSEVLLEQYITRDHLHMAALNDQSMARADLIRAKRKEVDFYQALRRERQHNPAAVFGSGYAGYGNGQTDGKARVVYPSDRRRPDGRRTRELRISRKDMAAQADQLEELVPIRLDIDHDKVKLRDTFTWNLHERTLTPELFAENLVEDLKLPPDQAGPVAQLVAQSLAEQIQDFYPQVFIEEEALDPHLPYHAYKNDEMRILIKLNITVGQHTLVDQFEWDINNPLNSPEEFAKQMTRDLSLSGEFTTAIAHSIREQSQLFTKSLYVTGHPFDGRPIEDADLRDAFLPSPLPSVFRPAQHAKDFTPYLYELNDAELDRTENSLSREQRRQKRSVNRRGGPALPDLKDRQRTVRTLIVSSVLPGAAESLDESRIFKRVEGASGRSGRRSGGGQRAGDDSDESESEESAPESPLPPPPPPPPAASNNLIAYGNTRTRGARGAATAAQLAMRANLGRSATPEASVLHHHETRTSARRFGGGREVREDSMGDGSSLLIKLRISKDKLRQFDRDRRFKPKTEPLQQPNAVHPASTHLGASSSSSSTTRPREMSLPSTGALQQRIPSTSTNGYASMMPQGMSALAVSDVPSQQLGAVDAIGPPQPGNPVVSGDSRKKSERSTLLHLHPRVCSLYSISSV